MRGSRGFLWAIALVSFAGFIGCDWQQAGRVESKITTTTTTTVVTGDATKSEPPGPPAVVAAPKSEPSNEAYAKIVDNPFQKPAEHPLSTFAIDVDTASYSNVRRFLAQGMLPPPDAVRVEEMINYFPYAYPPPKGDDPFSVCVEVARCPWDEGHRLARIALKGREIPTGNRPSSNLVFLLDVSGSMADANKLPLVKAALKLLVERLGENDRVAIVVYAGASGLVLPSTSCSNKRAILTALDSLQAGGSTNGGEGLKLAYDTAVASFIQGGTNRVILCTDGDFNVGITSQDELTRLIAAKAKSGVFLSALGFGMGNYKDATLERLADRGNGNSAYIDSLKEACKVLIEQMGGTLVTIAKDVKVQVEFNPARVASYRLVGYEDRMLKARDFNDDKKDAGEIGAGHTVTALYELIPAGREADAPGVDPLKYQKPATPPAKAGASHEMFTVKLRYKAPEGDTSKLIEFAIDDDANDGTPTEDFRFATAVAEFGLVLRNSPYKGESSWESVLELAESSTGPDPSGYRREFIDLVKKARSLPGR
jgi:Ca-activated chloride channel homolog